MSFSQSGEDVVSYSPDEQPPTLRSWSIGASGLFACLVAVIVVVFCGLVWVGICTRNDLTF